MTKKIVDLVRGANRAVDRIHLADDHANAGIAAHLEVLAGKRSEGHVRNAHFSVDFSVDREDVLNLLRKARASSVRVDPSIADGYVLNVRNKLDPDNDFEVYFRFDAHGIYVSTVGLRDVTITLDADWFETRRRLTAQV